MFQGKSRYVTKSLIVDPGLISQNKNIRVNPYNPRYPRAIDRTRITRIKRIYAEWM